MARADVVGFFWDDVPPPKAVRVKEKKTPPEPVWLLPTYLPHLEEARAFPFAQFEDWELAIAAAKGERLVFDIEVYENYFLIAFRSITSGKVTYLERTVDHTCNLDKLRWLIHTFCLISFNGIAYDAVILALVLAGKTNAELKEATNMLIAEQVRPADVLRKFKVKALRFNHIDVIEVAPLFASLKIYAGRLHCPRMQDLPFHPATVLSHDQITITRWYCINDLVNTELLYRSVEPEIKLRESMTLEYKLDLRSKSDAQIAEAVITDAVQKLSGSRLQRPLVEPGRVYRYRAPAFLRFSTPLMNWVMEHIRTTPFIVSEDGNIGMPPQLKDLKIQLGEGVYRMGIGGLHSSEQRATHYASDDVVLVDRDVTSFYPMIILLLGLAPEHLGKNFLTVYKRLVDRRVKAKHEGDKVVADSLKITVNGSFGKLGSPYSALYAPDLLIQVTVTGQLLLLMLVERFELAGIAVVSANTDGIVCKCPKHLEATMDGIVHQWERETGFETEATYYRALLSRDVNNYIAVKQNGSTKTKGTYASPERPADRLHKNPTSEICVDAVIALLGTGTPIESTVRGCKEASKFVSVRTVAGGAVKDGEYLGKAIRWYYAAGETGVIVAAKSGNTVPRSAGARPLMVLPSTVPADMDFDWYIAEANRMLVDIGYAT